MLLPFSLGSETPPSKDGTPRAFLKLRHVRGPRDAEVHELDLRICPLILTCCGQQMDFLFLRGSVEMQRKFSCDTAQRFSHPPTQSVSQVGNLPVFGHKGSKPQVENILIRLFWLFVNLNLKASVFILKHRELWNIWPLPKHIKEITKLISMFNSFHSFAYFIQLNSSYPETLPLFNLILVFASLGKHMVFTWEKLLP